MRETRGRPQHRLMRHVIRLQDMGLRQEALEPEDSHNTTNNVLSKDTLACWNLRLTDFSILISKEGRLILETTQYQP
jgi:hypothetical protein